MNPHLLAAAARLEAETARKLRGLLRHRKPSNSRPSVKHGQHLSTFAPIESILRLNLLQFHLQLFRLFRLAAQHGSSLKNGQQSLFHGPVFGEFIQHFIRFVRLT